jgi:hypothetical protein
MHGINKMLDSMPDDFNNIIYNPLPPIRAFHNSSSISFFLKRSRTKINSMSTISPYICADHNKRHAVHNLHDCKSVHPE